MDFQGQTICTEAGQCCMMMLTDAVLSLKEHEQIMFSLFDEVVNCEVCKVIRICVKSIVVEVIELVSLMFVDNQC